MSQAITRAFGLGGRTQGAILNLWRTTGSLFERASHHLSWPAASIASLLVSTSLAHLLKEANKRYG